MPATSTNHLWAMDFMYDQLATGRKIRILTVVDTFSRYAPTVDPRFSHRGEDVVLTLEKVCRNKGYPKTIRVDQGSEFISRDLDFWAYQKDIVLDFSCPSCFAIISKSANALNLPFFSKVSMRNARRRLRGYGFRVSKKKVRAIGSEG